jgi:hypothetical protein
MADRNNNARFRILEAYERAKTIDPSMTQGEFMRAGAPGSRVKGLVGRFSNDESAARYFRKIKSGERTGGSMYEEGRSKGTIGSFQFRVRMKDRYISQNIAMVGGASTFDIYAVEHELRTNPQRRADIERLVGKYRQKYGQEFEPVDFESLTARPVTKVHTPYRFWGAID